MDISALWLFAAFGGGAFGAAIGPQTAFVFTCIMYLIGLGGAMGDFAALGSAEAGFGAQEYFNVVVFGPPFGPHIAFAGGAAGTAYAHWKGYHPNGRDIVTPLPVYEKIDVFAVAGLFGVLGYVYQSFFAWILPTFKDSSGNPVGNTDVIAMCVVLVAITAKLFFGVRSKNPLGPFTKGISPFAVEEGYHWVQHQEKYSHSTWYGFSFGIIFALGSATLVAAFPDNPVVGGLAANLGWAVSGVSLFFITFGHKTPVTHHMTLIAGLGAVVWMRIATDWDFAAATQNDILIATVVGAICGGITGFLGEILSRLFNARGDVHVDPPAFAIFPMTTILLGFQAAMM